MKLSDRRATPAEIEHALERVILVIVPEELASCIRTSRIKGNAVKPLSSYVRLSSHRLQGQPLLERSRAGTTPGCMSCTSRRDVPTWGC
jgi:hypothetical protein